MTPRQPRRTRDQTREEILSAVALVVTAQGFLPAPVEQIARAAGVSKALIYAYFPTQAALANALIVKHLEPLALQILALRARTPEKLGLAAAGLYFDHVCEHGALLHLLFTDPFMDGRRDRASLALRNRLWRKLARSLRLDRALSVKASFAVLSTLLAVPEELGRMARRGELTRSAAQQLMDTMLVQALRGARRAAP